MLQLDVTPYASDALEDAMRMAQTKALNSYTFSDCLLALNNMWMDIYNRLAQMDEGYYSVTIQLKEKLTRLPPFVKNTIKVYAAKDMLGYNREIYRASGYNDMMSYGTYHLSGFDLYCPDVERRKVFLNYIPQQPQIFFTRNNRDPKIYSNKDVLPEVIRSADFNLYTLEAYSAPLIPPEPPEHDPDDPHSPEPLPEVPEIGTSINIELDGVNIEDIAVLRLVPKDGSKVEDYTLDISSHVLRNVFVIDDYTRYPIDDQRWKDWRLSYISCDYPYIFVTYKNVYTEEHISGFWTGFVTHGIHGEFVHYNPFAFTGRNSNVEYMQTKWNDKTGLGVIITDYNDIVPPPPPKKPEESEDEEDEDPVDPPEPEPPLPPEYRIKELGWTPDTKLVYPGPEVYRLLVARLAEKFALYNESQIMLVQSELVSAQYAFDNFIKKDKSAWQRIDNVNGPNLGDLL